MKQSSEELKIPRWFGLVAGAAASALVGTYYAFWVERGWLQPTYHTIEIEGLPVEWRGFRLAYLSDLHIEDDTFQVKAVEDAVARVVAERPDLVALGGDYSDHGRWNKNLHRILSPLAEAGLPMVAVMGNHDYHAGMRGRFSIERGLRELGVTVLIDDACPFTYKGITQWILGIDDVNKGIGDFGKASAKIPAGERPFLMLAHSPAFLNEAPPHSCGLALCGHMHGGQINPVPYPFKERWNWVKWGFDINYAQGWYEVRGNRFYVGRGLGVTKLPVRFGARPELPFFELV